MALLYQVTQERRLHFPDELRFRDLIEVMSQLETEQDFTPGCLLLDTYLQGDTSL